MENIIALIIKLIMQLIMVAMQVAIRIAMLLGAILVRLIFLLLRLLAPLLRLIAAVVFRLTGKLLQITSLALGRFFRPSARLTRQPRGSIQPDRPLIFGHTNATPRNGSPTSDGRQPPRRRPRR